MTRQRAKLDIKIHWGGDWTGFRDGPHFELNRKVYPAPSSNPHPGP